MPRTDRPEWVLARRREVGHRIATLRAGRGLSIDQLAERAGVGRLAVIRAENGRVSTGVDLLLMIAAGLDVDAAELMTTPPQ